MNVLVAIADDCCSKHILSYLSRQKWSPETTLRLINVRGDDKQRRSRIRRAHTKPMPTGKFLEKFAGQLATKLPNIQSERNVLNGQPAAQIIAQAESWPADLIVIGAHGRKGIDRFLLGSMSHAVLDGAHCSVAIVKLPPIALLDMNLCEDDLPQQISSFELCEVS